MKIDEIDRRILKKLQQQGKITNMDLAEAVNLSPSACLRRVQFLEREGVIIGYGALLDPSFIQRKALIFIEVSLQSQSIECLNDFEQAVQKIPDVLECHLMAGKTDYLIKICAADSEDFARIHKQYLSCLPHVLHMQSNFTLKTVRSTTNYPL